jgi:hypothetical protein
VRDPDRGYLKRPFFGQSVSLGVRGGPDRGQLTCPSFRPISVTRRPWGFGIVDQSNPGPDPPHGLSFARGKLRRRVRVLRQVTNRRLRVPAPKDRRIIYICHMRRFVVVTLALSACMTPYQRMGFSGGYDEKMLDNGDYVVTVKVNGFTDRATALEYLHRRAGELCPQGFDFADRTGGDNGGIVATRDYVGENHKPEEDAVVRCKKAPAEEAEAPVPERAPTGMKRKIVYGERPIFCSPLPTDDNAGPCFLDEAVCNETRAKDPDAHGTCESRSAVACFNARRTLDDTHASFCSVSVKACEAERASYEQNPDFTNVIKMCGVYRVGPARGGDH